MITLEAITKRFGHITAVDRLALTIDPGEVFGLLGPNGAGKSTTIAMAVGLLRPDSGTARIDGGDPADASVRGRLGVAPQALAVYDDLSARENLHFFGSLYGLNRAHRAERADELLELVGLTDRAGDRVKGFSGGMKRRVNLACALVHDPAVILLDEPTAGVDPKARREFWDEIHGLAADGITVLVSTHYMDEAERCHELAYIAFGELLAQGTAKEVVAESGLSTWNVSGPDLHRLAAQLQFCDGIDMVAPFGAELHVSGRNKQALDEAIAAAKKADGAHRWTRGEPSLEDVFILLMNHAKDNFA
jgi:ABC-2 type transport system ATP-binding protein